MCLVAHTHKAWHIGLHHHRFTGHRLAREQCAVHCFVVGISHETPCGDALRQGKFDVHLALGIGREGRIEESRLVEIFSEGIAIAASVLLGSSLLVFCCLVFHLSALSCHFGGC